MTLLPLNARRLVSIPALFVLTASAAQAHLLSGRVLDTTGAPVASVDIDVFDAVTGNELTLSGDFTLPDGTFSFDVPTGLYDVVFRPPAPPATTHLSTTRAGVLVTAGTALGDVTLPAGLSLSGRVVDTIGFGVAGVDLDFIDATTGAALIVTAGTTGTNGEFLVAVPAGPLEVEIEPSETAVPRFAPERLELDLAANTALGDIPLEPGFLVTMTLRRANGTPVGNVDLDVTRTSDGYELLTPGDNTDNMGFVDVVVPAGSYTIQACPPFSQTLVSLELGPLNVAADTALGAFVLEAGAVLSGTVLDAQGQPLEGVDLDLIDTTTGLEVPLCGDNTGANGQYAVVVPFGTFNIVMATSFSRPYGTDQHAGVTVAGPTTLNGALPDCGCLAASGAGRAGTGGVVPSLTALGGCLRIPNPNLSLSIEDVRGGAMGLLFAGVVHPNAVMLPAGAPPRPRLSLGHFELVAFNGAAGVAGAGSASVTLPLGFVPTAFAGSTFHAAVMVRDSGATGSVAWTPAHTGLLCQ